MFESGSLNEHARAGKPNTPPARENQDPGGGAAAWTSIGEESTLPKSVAVNRRTRAPGSPLMARSGNAARPWASVVAVAPLRLPPPERIVAVTRIPEVAAGAPLLSSWTSGAGLNGASSVPD